MEKRRKAVRFAAQAVGLALFAGAAGACTPPLEGTRLESPRFVLAYRAGEVAVGRHFIVEIGACAKDGRPAPEALAVNAHMPAHRHGMNYAPSVAALGPGRWRAEGLLFHMPGKWELVFELRSGGTTDVLRGGYTLSEAVRFSEEETRRILAHGPWPPQSAPDPSNRASGRIEAVALGERLFFEPRLSGTGSVLCASCHVPHNAFQDGRPRALGLEEVDRNTQGLLNVRFARWFGWDGASDNLWAQSVRPLLDPREMRSSPAQVAAFIRGSAAYARGYERAFSRPPPADDDLLLADIGKALAAYQETLVSGRTPFDEFRDALARGEPPQATGYPAAAQRGLKIFVGKGNCALCHFGPLFTNGEFADTGVPFFARKGVVDPGRHRGIGKLKADALNLLGRFNDDPMRATAVKTRHVQAQHRNFGEFRVPGLREASRTAPYMHNGSLATLRDVVRFYSNLNEERLHADGERILRPLHLDEAEIDDLAAFLESLASPWRACGRC